MWHKLLETYMELFADIIFPFFTSNCTLTYCRWLGVNDAVGAHLITCQWYINGTLSALSDTWSFEMQTWKRSIFLRLFLCRFKITLVCKANHYHNNRAKQVPRYKKFGNTCPKDWQRLKARSHTFSPGDVLMHSIEMVILYIFNPIKFEWERNQKQKILIIRIKRACGHHLASWLKCQDHPYPLLVNPK